MKPILMNVLGKTYEIKKGIVNIGNSEACEI